MTTFPEETDKLLNELVLEVGRQVTEAYERKRGIWEGMSLENVRSKDKTRDRFLNLVSERIIGEGTKHFKVFDGSNGHMSQEAVDERIWTANTIQEQQRTTLYEGTKEEI